MLTHQRYLEAKKAVDDRTLNLQLISTLKSTLPKENLRVVELGAGIGTMVARCLEREMLREGDYTFIDNDRQNIDYAHRYLLDWAVKNDIFAIAQGADSLLLRDRARDLSVHLVCSDVTDSRVLRDLGEFDLLLAHLFLDLVDARRHLERFLRLLKPGGIFYLSHMYDGLTTILPEMDADQTILQLYNGCMDEREDDRSAYPRSHTGREVLQLLLDMKGVEIIEAGSSDWVVFPRRGGYTIDERDFLHYIIGIIEGALRNVDTIEPEDLREWIRTRRRQIDNGEMALITHQLDVVGKYYD
jgi:SAM-dependent methyltransferase